MITQFKDVISHEKIQAITDSLEEGITIINKDGKFVYANSNAAKLVGFDSTAELMKTPVPKVRERFEVYDIQGKPLPPERLPTTLILSGKATSAEATLLFKHDSGKPDRWFLVRSLPILGENGNVEYTINILREITEQKRAEDILKQSESNFRLLAETIPQIVWIASPDGSFEWANKRYYEFTGTHPEDTQKGWALSIHPNYQEESRKKWENSLKTGELYEAEYPLEKSISGEYRWYLARAQPVRDQNGKIIKWIGTSTDIHETKMAQEALAKAEKAARFVSDAGVVLGSSLEYDQTLKKIAELIVPQMADWCSVSILDPGQTVPRTVCVQHHDPKKLQWALSLQNKFPQNWSAATGVPRVLREGVSELYKEIPDELLEKAAQNQEHLEVLKSLGIKSAMIVPIVGDSRTLGAISFVASEKAASYDEFDLSVAEDLGRRAGLAIERSLLYESEKQSKEAAEAANQAKTTFLANMSHEMRTPLNALIGFNEILQDPNLSPEERQKYHAVITRNGDLLLRLIDDILDLSKVEAGHLTIEELTISLPDLVSDVTNTFKLKASAKELNFVVESLGKIPEWVVTDPVRLKQILNNIVGNAIKFTSRGEVGMTIEYEPSSDLLRFVVRDSGPGISPAKRAHLFKPFSQGDPSMTRKFGGTGLGLILSRRLARSLGGDVQLEEFKEGEGAVFTILVPAHISKAKVFPRVERKNISAPADNKPLSGKRVLLVEDSPDNQLLIEKVLKAQGARVDLASNGQLGVELAMKGDYDVVLMDIQMPVLDGYSATRILRNAGFDRPIIALTAHALLHDRSQCIEVGCTDFLTKPVKPSTLTETIQKYS